MNSFNTIACTFGINHTSLEWQHFNYIKLFDNIVFTCIKHYLFHIISAIGRGCVMMIMEAGSYTQINKKNFNSKMASHTQPRNLIEYYHIIQWRLLSRIRCRTRSACSAQHYRRTVHLMYSKKRTTHLLLYCTYCRLKTM